MLIHPATAFAISALVPCKENDVLLNVPADKSCVAKNVELSKLTEAWICVTLAIELEVCIFTGVKLSSKSCKVEFISVIKIWLLSLSIST